MIRKREPQTKKIIRTKMGSKGRSAKCKINHMDFISWKQGLAVAIITKY